MRSRFSRSPRRVLAECGGICKGICIDVGCGPGHLDVELERRSDFTIIGLDINRDMKPLFEKRMREAGLQERMSFVVGDAQKMPFPTDVTSTRRKSTRSRRRS